MIRKVAVAVSVVLGGAALTVRWVRKGVKDTIEHAWSR